jgi:hypothetical protein
MIKKEKDSEESKAHEQFAELIEKYKVQNPVKFARKQVRLEAKLAEL